MPSSFGRYTLIRRVAVGGMAEIWKAKVTGAAGFQKTVAIKRVLPELARDADFVAMFIQEAKLAAELVHPNIVQVFDFGQVGNDEYYIAMEYVPGTNVGVVHRRALERGGTLPMHAALYVVAQAAKGLGYAHSRVDPGGRSLDLIHRDVSPQNILVSFEGDVKVADFGIAKAASASSRTSEGQVRGKLGYMSPEQAQSRRLDARSDLFSLGIVLYELLSGKRLFHGATPADTYARVAGFRGLQREDLDAVAEECRGILAKTLAIPPEDRFQTGEEMETALAHLLGREGEREARSRLRETLVGLFDHEFRLEQTPTGPTDTVAETVLATALGSAAGLATETEKATVPPTGTATLPSNRVVVRASPPGAASAPGAKSRIFLLALALGATTVALTFLLPGAPAPPAPPSPIPTPTVIAEITAARTPSPAGIDIETPAPLPKPTVLRVPTPRPPPSTPRASVTAVAAAKQGTLSVTSRPWVQVWVDGKLVTKETPLVKEPLPAGLHVIRFVNHVRGFDLSRPVEIPPGGAVSISVDVSSGEIAVTSVP